MSFSPLINAKVNGCGGRILNSRAEGNAIIYGQTTASSTVSPKAPRVSLNESCSGWCCTISLISFNLRRSHRLRYSSIPAIKTPINQIAPCWRSERLKSCTNSRQDAGAKNHAIEFSGLADPSRSSVLNCESRADSGRGIGRTLLPC